LSSSTVSPNSSLEKTVGVVAEVKAAADLILTTIETVAPSVGGEAAMAQNIVDLVATMVQKALSAYSAASGVEVNAETVLALLPNPTPLTPPTL
jgi:hypothetical protein